MRSRYFWCICGKYYSHPQMFLIIRIVAHTLHYYVVRGYTDE